MTSLRPWNYKQKTGELLGCDGMSWGYGFSGHGLGFNNPALQDMHEVGPLPVGLYKWNTYIEKHPTMGLCVIILQPVDEKGDVRTAGMYGRGGFAMHGAVSLDTHGAEAFLASSDGCICYKDCTARKAVWAAAAGQLLLVMTA